MFLNYFLAPELRAKAGVDVTELAPMLNVKVAAGQRLVMRWERNLMGGQSSPYNSIRTFLWGEDIVKGNRTSVDQCGGTT